MEAGSLQDRIIAEGQRQAQARDEAAKRVAVLLEVDPLDGNDPIQAEVHLPIVPRTGDIIEMWDSESGFINTATEKHPHPNYSGEPLFPRVMQVTLCSYGPSRIVVSLEFDTFDLEQVKRVMKGAQEGMAP